MKDFKELLLRTQQLHIFLSIAVVYTNFPVFHSDGFHLRFILKQKNSVLLKSKLPCQSHLGSWCKYQWSCNFWHTFSMTHPMLSQLILHSIISETETKWVLGFWIISNFCGEIFLELVISIVQYLNGIFEFLDTVIAIGIWLLVAEAWKLLVVSLSLWMNTPLWKKQKFRNSYVWCIFA